MAKITSKIYNLFLKVCIFLIPLFLTSCGNVKGKGMKYPEPDENPVYLTSDAQTKSVYVKNITWILEENPEMDLVEETDIQPRWKVIRNDWIKIRFGNDVPERTIEITVKENTSSEERSYNLEMSGTLPPITNIFLNIVQEGKRID